jgi:hypothetical protein
MTKEENEDGGSTPPASRKRKRQLSFDEAWNALALWRSKEMQLAEVHGMFVKKEISNLTRIRLNQKLVNDSAADEREEP